MKALVMTVAAIATALGVAYGLELLFPHGHDERVQTPTTSPLDRVMQRPLSPAPMPSDARLVADDGEVIKAAPAGDAPLSEDMAASTTPTTAPMETAPALTVEPSAAPAPALPDDADAPVTAASISPTSAPPSAAAPATPAPAATDVPPPTPVSTAAAGTADADRAQEQETPAANVTPTPLPPPTAQPSPPPQPTAGPTPRPSPVAPTPTVPSPTAAALEAWWADARTAEGLNIVFDGSAAFDPAIVLLLSGTVADGRSADANIKVTDHSGAIVNGQWQVSRENNAMLVLSVEQGGLYRVEVGAGLEDSQGRRLGRALGGLVHVR